MNKITLEEFDIKYMEIINKHDIPIDVIKESYDKWIKHQEYAESVSEEEKNKYKYVIWDDFPTAESWINHEIEEFQRQKASSEAMRKYMGLPWYEKILTENGECNIKNQLIEAFINNQEGQKIFGDLCRWDLMAIDLFYAIKHFSSYVTDPEKKITDEEIKNFVNTNKQTLDNWGKGICADGGRVLRTIKFACELFCQEMI